MGAPDRKVIGLVGDGGLMSVIGALATAVELDIPVLWVLFNNFCYSTILSVGSTYFGNKYGTEFTRPDGTPYNPDFMLLAKSFGIESALVEEPDASRGSAGEGDGGQGSLSPRGAHARRRADAAHRLLGHRRLSEARQRIATPSLEAAGPRRSGTVDSSSLPLWRSLLYVPVNVEKYVDKAHTRGADCIQLDLEDSVPEAEKERARSLVQAAAATRAPRRCGRDRADQPPAIDSGARHRGVSRARA